DCLFFSTCPRPPVPTLFPYTTLFRSVDRDRRARPPDRAAAPPRGDRRRGSGGGRVARRMVPRDRAGRVTLPSLHEDSIVVDLHRSEDTRLNSSHQISSYAVFCLKKKN